MPNCPKQPSSQWHSDQFHAAHHRYFECNYGTPGFPFDVWFGSFRETMAPTTRSYRGAAQECISQPDKNNGFITARSDTKSNLLGLPGWDQAVYMIATAIGLPLFVIYVMHNRKAIDPSIAASVVSLGPLMLSIFLSTVTASPSVSSFENLLSTLLYPFHKDPVVGKFGLGILLGILLSVMPTFHFFESLFVTDPRDTVYNQIWNR